MLKFIIVAVVAFGVWAYFTGFNFKSINVGDLQKNATQIGNEAATNTFNNLKNEKTIFKVNDAARQTNAATQEALNNQ